LLASSGIPLWEPQIVAGQEQNAKNAITKTDLMREAAACSRKPVDARVNRAGKPNVIPDLNGIEVDIETTWQKVHQKGKIDKDLFVYKQVPARVKMGDYPDLPVYQGNPGKKEMALMINVAWGTEFIDGILQLLKEKKVKATFFLDGSWLTKNPDTARRIAAEGHEIGNHAFTHPDMAKLSMDRQLSEIQRTQQKIKEVLHKDSKWFAPPSGSYNAATVKLARSQGMGTVLWTLDSVDWKRPPQADIVNRIGGNARNGALVLMHPTQPTLGALHILIPELQKKGFRLVTVSELLSPERKVE
jgi:probable sporulation protein (polysaccharide deacetylase family)